MNKLLNCTVDGEDVILPKYETVRASGMDVRAWKFALPNNPSVSIDFPEEGIVLSPLQRVLIKTGIHVELREDEEIQIRARSGLALKNGITVTNGIGTIDEDYRGDVGVILINLSNEDFTIKKNDRIAQIVVTKVEKRDLHIVNELSETKRGDGGFNSTGTK
jgi:dUTP pyrophosphatase